MNEVWTLTHYDCLDNDDCIGAWIGDKPSTEDMINTIENAGIFSKKEAKRITLGFKEYSYKQDSYVSIYNNEALILSKITAKERIKQ